MQASILYATCGDEQDSYLARVSVSAVFSTYRLGLITCNEVLDVDAESPAIHPSR